MTTSFKGQLASFGGQVYRFTDILNDRFVSVGATFGSITRRFAGMVKRGSRASGPEEVRDARPLRNKKIVAQARIRLSELHLQVGQTIYNIEQTDEGEKKLSRQLIALLDEIERLEAVLRKIDVDADPPTEEIIAEVEALIELEPTGDLEAAR